MLFTAWTPTYAQRALRAPEQAAASVQRDRGHRNFRVPWGRRAALSVRRAEVACFAGFLLPLRRRSPSSVGSGPVKCPERFSSRTEQWLLNPTLVG
eukprot:s481_g11.t1